MLYRHCFALYCGRRVRSEGDQREPSMANGEAVSQGTDRREVTERARDEQRSESPESRLAGLSSRSPSELAGYEH